MSRHEVIFGFENEAYRQYLSQPHPGPETADRLAGSMLENGHPLTVYAAGWVAAELAQIAYPRPGSAEVSYDRRIEAMGLARQRWSAALGEFPAIRSGQASQDMVGQVWGFEMRALQALAFAPEMEAAAAMLGGRPHEPAQLAAAHRDTIGRSAEVAKFMLSLPAPTMQMRSMKRGVASELACGIVGQVSDGDDYLLVPASLRQDNNKKPYLKADYIAVSAARPHRKTLVQVTSSVSHGTSRPLYLEFVARQHFVTSRGTTVTDTLADYIAWSAGELDAPREQALKDMANASFGAIGEYDKQRTHTLATRRVARRTVSAMLSAGTRLPFGFTNKQQA